MYEHGSDNTAVTQRFCACVSYETKIAQKEECKVRRQFEQTQAIPILAGPGRWRWRSEVKLLTPEPIQSREKDSRNIEARLPI